MERAIEFRLQSRAAHDTRPDQLTAQVAETSRQLQAYAGTQTQFIEIAARTMTGLAEAQARTDARFDRTNDRLDRLAALVEQHISGHGAQRGG